MQVEHHSLRKASDKKDRILKWELVPNHVYVVLGFSLLPDVERNQIVCVSEPIKRL